MAGLGEGAPLGDADIARRYDDARGRAAERYVFEAGLQVWAARCRWSLSQEAAELRQLERAQDQLWRAIEAAMQVRATRQLGPLPEET